MCDKKWVNFTGCRNNGSDVMAKDYAKYTLYRKSRSRRSRLWTLLGLTTSLLVLAIVPFFLNHRPAAVAPISEKVERKYPRHRPHRNTALLEAPKPLSPEPKFDFYNVLPKDKLTLSGSAKGLFSGPAEEKSAGQLTTPSVALTPEQLAIAEAKKQLEREVSQLGEKTGYILILGEFPEAQQAEQSQAQALLRGFPVKSMRVEQQGKEIYQIFIGPYPDLVSVAEQKKRLMSAGISTHLEKQTA